MDIHRYTPAGRLDRTCGLRPEQADRLYQQVSWQAKTPFAPYFRITLVNDEGRIVRDTDHEFYGRSTVIPQGTVMFAGSPPVDKVEQEKVA